MLQAILGTNSKSGSCDHREQSTALVALGVAMLLAVGTVIAAVMFEPEGGTPLDPAASSMAGLGGGTGGGYGSGVGSGGGATGDGPGAGRTGTGKGASGTDVTAIPKGRETGAVAGGEITTGQSLATGPVREAPKWGFTLPDKDEPIEPPTGTSAVGARNGGNGEGRAGAGGGGRVPNFMGVPADARDIVYILDFSGSMAVADDGRLPVLKQELAASLRSLRPDCRFSIILFGLSQSTGSQQLPRPNGNFVWTNAIPMPPGGQWLGATPANVSSAIAWVNARQADPQSGSGMWDSMRLAFEMKPQAIFLLTDGETAGSDGSETFDVIAEGNKDRSVRIHTVAFATDGDVPTLQRIASENGGTYRRVPLTQPKP